MFKFKNQQQEMNHQWTKTRNTWAQHAIYTSYKTYRSKWRPPCQPIIFIQNQTLASMPLLHFIPTPLEEIWIVYQGQEKRGYGLSGMRKTGSQSKQGSSDSEGHVFYGVILWL